MLLFILNSPLSFTFSVSISYQKNNSTFFAFFILRKKWLRYKDAEIVYSLEHKKILEMADQCGAIYRRDGIVLINRDIFDEYLERFHQPTGMYQTNGNREKKLLDEKED